MEIKAELLKPYTDEQRIKFIVENNHKKGYTIEESATSLVALGETEEEKQAKEQERIASLTVTKRVFALALQELGVTYSQLKAVIAQNEQAQLEWDLCVELERGNPLLDVMASYMNISPKMLDYIFQKANGEDVEMQTELLSQ